MESFEYHTEELLFYLVVHYFQTISPLFKTIMTISEPFYGSNVFLSLFKNVHMRNKHNVVSIL